MKAYLDADVDPEESRYGDNTFDIHGQEWLVLTEDEADEAVYERILEDLWAFRPEYLQNWTETPADILQGMQEKLCEKATPIVRRLIGEDNLDRFVADAVGADGRGHFISGYDGNECDMGDFYGYRLN